MSTANAVGTDAVGTDAVGTDAVGRHPLFQELDPTVLLARGPGQFGVPRPQFAL